MTKWHVFLTLELIATGAVLSSAIAGAMRERRLSMRTVAMFLVVLSGMLYAWLLLGALPGPISGDDLRPAAAMSIGLLGALLLWRDARAHR